MDALTAMKQALEALEYHTEQTRPIDKTDEAAQALRYVIAEDEPASLFLEFIDGDYAIIRTDALFASGFNCFKRTTQAGSDFVKINAEGSWFKSLESAKEWLSGYRSHDSTVSPAPTFTDQEAPLS